MPSSRKRRDEFYKGAPNAKFVHYTTAEAALSIIKTKRIWMRNTTCMSDFREIHHGRGMLEKHFIHTNAIKEFGAAVDKYAPGVAAEAFELFDSWWTDTQINTYITSISEHDEKENEHGRLSMWRAFGGTSPRVAIVLNLPWLPNGSLNLNIHLSPVIYHDESDICNELKQILENLEKNGDFLKTVSKDEIKGSIFTMLMTSVICAKHEGFREEREWRAVYMPMKSPSKLMESEISVINGLPQVVYKIPLDRNSHIELDDLDFANLFDRLIIGPTQFPVAMAEAFNNELLKIGVKAPKISISGIPIRT